MLYLNGEECPEPGGQADDPAEAPGQPDAPPDDESAGPSWQCPHCGEMVPANFDTCWKCLAAKAGEPAADANQLLAETGEEAAAPPVAPIQCLRCGSTAIIPDASLVDVGTLRPIEAVVFGDPQAVVFKDRQYTEVIAAICGQCGHIELRVTNPAELYDHYLQARIDKQSDKRRGFEVVMPPPTETR